MRLKTTQQAFGDKLHTYTIVDAINDGNVLPFRIDYVNTMKEKTGIADEQISAIDREKAMASPERVSQIVKYIIDHFDQKTMRSSYYSFRVLDDIHKVASAKKGISLKEHKTEQKLNGFNAMFAVLPFRWPRHITTNSRGSRQIYLRPRDLRLRPYTVTVPMRRTLTVSWQRRIRRAPRNWISSQETFWRERSRITTRCSPPITTRPETRYEPSLKDISGYKRCP